MDTTPRPHRSTCIVFLTHKVNTKTFQAARDLYNSCKEEYDVSILLDERAGSPDTANHAPTIPVHTFSIQNLRERYRLFGSPEKPDVTPGNNIFALLDFCRHHPYRYYWLVEYDVRYSGEWVDFFKQFEYDESDLLGTTLHDYAYKPSWFWWSSLKTPFFRFLRKRI